MLPINFAKTLVLLLLATGWEAITVAATSPTKRLDRHGDALPPGAMARMGTIRFRHDHSVRIVQFSRDGKTLLGDASIDSPGGGRVWEADTGKEVARFRGSGLGYYPTFSPDGQLLVDVDGNHLARLWDFATGKILRSWGGETTPGKKEYWTVSWAYFSRDGKLLVLHGKQNNKDFLRRFDLQTGKELRRHEWEDGTADFFVTSPDARSLLGVHGNDKMASLLDLETGKKTPLLKTSEEFRNGFVFSPDGKLIAVIDQGQTSVMFWDTATGKLIRALKNGPIGFSYLRGDHFSPNGKWFAVNGKGDRNVLLYELATGKLLRAVNNGGGEHYQNLFSPDSKLLATGTDGGANICIWEVATGKRVCRFDLNLGDNGFAGSMAFSPDSKRLAFPSGRLIKIGDIATGNLLPPDAGHDEPPSALVFSSDGKTLTTGGRDGGFRDWRVTTGQELKHFPDANLWSALGLPRDGRILAAIDKHWSVSIWDVRAGKELHKVDPTAHWRRNCTFSADCQLLATTSDNGDIHVFDNASGKKLHHFPWYAKPEPTSGGKDDTPVLAFSTDGRILAALGQSRPKIALYDKANPHRWVLRIWELATGQERQRIYFDDTGGFGEWANLRGEYQGMLHPLKFSADNKMFSVATSRSLCLYSIATGKEVRRFSRQGLLGFAGVFSADGRMAAAPDDFGRVFVWETDTATLLTTFYCGSGHARLLAFSADGKRLASAGSDGVVVVWDLGHFLKRDLHDHKQLETAWHTLADADAAKAFQATVALTEQPQDALAVLKKHWRPAALPDAKRFQRLVTDLSSPQFAIRQKATREIEMLQELAEPGLKKALTATGDLETRRRLEYLLGKLAVRTPSPGLLQSLRAIEVLERIGSAEACQVLQSYAKGMPGYRATDAATAALQRLADQSR